MSYFLVRGTAVRAEREQLRASLDTVASLAGTNANRISQYEREVSAPTIALQREIQHVLYFLRAIQDACAFPIDFSDPGKLRPAWEEYCRQRLPAERAQTVEEMNAAGETANQGNCDGEKVTTSPQS